MVEKSNERLFLLKQLRNSEEIFVLFSKCTRMPYVKCDEETFDDQIYIFRKEEDAKAALTAFLAEKVPVQVVKVPKEQFLKFYSGLYPMGVNAMIVDQGAAEERLQIEELVKQPDYSKLQEGQVRVENPVLHLTAAYLMQQLRKDKEVKMTPQLKELEEEMFANFRKGTYIVPVKNNTEIPLMKMSDEKVYQPIFTDMVDFQKFDTKQEFRSAVIVYDNLKKAVVPQAEGVVINPLGIHVVLKRDQFNR